MVLAFTTLYTVHLDCIPCADEQLIYTLRDMMTSYASLVMNPTLASNLRKLLKLCFQMHCIK